MSTVDIAECRRLFERYIMAEEHRGSESVERWHIRRRQAANAVLPYLPLLLNEVEQLRKQTREDAILIGQWVAAGKIGR